QRARGYSLGACEYLVKPVEPERLVEVVRKAVVPGTGDVLVVDDEADTRNLDGFELLRRMRADGVTAPVIVLTGKDLSKDEERRLREGLARVVTKGGL